MISPEKIKEKLLKEGYTLITSVPADFRTFELWGNEKDITEPNKVIVIFHPDKQSAYAKIYSEITNDFIDCCKGLNG